ncbi:MAG TPA: tripartite tricarboxylate transporter TctB family protein [Hyphomicrobiaceae bacterium]|nr:tripartite tricarboxylate transporter TctB family protein [Hyphomicrobiaceae bacterium]
MKNIVKIPLSTDLLSGLGLIGLGGFALGYGWRYAFGTAARMGPGFYPRLVSLALIAIGAALVVRSLVRHADELGTIELRPVALVLLSTVLFAFLIERAGLVASTVLLTVLARLADEDFRPAEVLLLCLVLVLFSSAVFWYGLALPFRLLPF